MRKHIHIILLVLVFLLAFFLRFYRFWDIPPGLNQDETSIGYNAYSILKTGKDEWGQTLPVYFRSFGDYKLPVYIYLTAGSIKLFGLDAFAVRFPSVLFGTLTVIVLYFLVLDLSKNKWFSLLCSVFLAINPWHLFFSRAAFEDNIALFFAVFGTWMFIKATKGKNAFIFLIASLCTFVLSLYSYNVTRLLSPLLVCILLMLFSKTIKVTKKQGIVTGLVALVLLLPFVLTFFSRAGAVSAAGALITSADITAKSVEMKSYLREISRILGVLVYNKVWFLPWQYAQNLVGFFSSNFFFISGTEHGTQGIGDAGMFYLYEFPFIIAGFVLFFAKKIKYLSLFLWWAVVTFLVAGLSKEVPHATRDYFLVIPLTIFSAYGFYEFLLWRKNFKKIILSLALIFVVTYGLINYFVSYYLRFPVVYASEWQVEDQAISLYLKSQEKDYAEIIIDPDTHLRYSSILFYQQVDPTFFLQKVQPAEPNDEGLTWGRDFGKYSFHHVNWGVDYKRENVLLVTPVNRVTGNVVALKLFKLPKRFVTLANGEQVATYISEEVAYAVIKSHPTQEIIQ